MRPLPFVPGAMLFELSPYDEPESDIVAGLIGEQSLSQQNRYTITVN